MTVLLAKSRTHGELTLEQHLLDTEQSAVALFGGATRWADRWPRFFKLDPADPRFLRELRIAALFHDIGKANEDFQRAVTSSAFFAQTLRHEHLSALVMSLPDVRGWLVAAGIDADICTAAVLSHHLKARDEEGDWRWGQFTEAPRLELYLDSEPVQSILKRIASIVGAEQIPTIPSGPLLSEYTGPWLDAFRGGREAATKFRRSLRKDIARRSRLIAVKVGLIVSDAVASGLFRVGESIEQWVTMVAHRESLNADAIRRDVIGARLRKIGGGVETALHPFQQKAADIGPRGLLLAACGAGKTLAAWAWAEAQARSRPVGRVIFLYPTRGTATEGFRDYAAWAPEGEATLLHGTADYELERMRENPPEAAVGKRLGESEAESRLFALGLWSKRYFSATVDQFLSVMQHRYEAICLLPALADAAVIVDEVHSFDPKMFESLIAFLKEFDVPVLCMTATLPTARREQLESVGLRVFPSSEEAMALADLSAKERAPRYKVRRSTDAQTLLPIAVDAYRAGRRVLWVVNQVSRAQALATELEQALAMPVLCYHSRFRLADRQAAHAKTIEVFQQTSAPAIAVTTQVCEMSLDLDADVLITEECPVTSLVQRFGRSNRHLRKPGVLADVITYPPPEGQMRPYTKADMSGVEVFLSKIAGSAVCQADLAGEIEALASNETAASGASSLFDSGYYAVPHDFRDLDEFARPCVLSSDVEEFKRCSRNRQAGLIVPVPRKFAMTPFSDAGLPAFLGLADSQYYDARRGFITPQREVS